jgi:hypothetical protein
MAVKRTRNATLFDGILQDEFPSHMVFLSQLYRRLIFKVLRPSVRAAVVRVDSPHQTLGVVKYHEGPGAEGLELLTHARTIRYSSGV